MSNDTETIVIVDDRLWRSIVRDTYSAAILLALTMIGRVLDIAVLSWIGGLFWVVFIFSAAQRIFNNNRRTLAEAKDYIEELEEQNGN